MNNINLGNLTIPVEDFAIQGNAILGIKESGKSYAGIYLAEQLLNHGIPFVTFDQIGVWKNIKIPAKEGGKAYSVVVAGGKDGDLPITPDTAPQIVRAAMQNNIPLVIDLYDVRLSKANKRQIVERCVEVLLYENEQYGARHIFIEEAPEVVPQMVRADVAKVYGIIESLCRMGGNSLLGYTLIGQRAEEINKAVLELCDCLFLFRQKGRNSLNALNKWMSIADVTTSGEIGKSIPTLGAGECWVWPRATQSPTLTQIPQKKTFHPDRRKPLVGSRPAMVDVQGFVDTMYKSLNEQVEEQVEKLNKKPKKEQSPTFQYNILVPDPEEVQSLRDRIAVLEMEVRQGKSVNEQLYAKLDTLRKQLEPEYNALKKIFDDIGVQSESTPARSFDSSKWNIWLEKLDSGSGAMLQTLIERKRVNRNQLGLLIGVAPHAKGGVFNRYKVRLTKLGLAYEDGDDIVLSEIP